MTGVYGTFAHHLRSRSDKRLRWVPENGIALCLLMHKFAHEQPLEFLKHLAAVLPERADWRDNVATQLSRPGQKIRVQDVIDKLKADLATLPQ